MEVDVDIYRFAVWPPIMGLEGNVDDDQRKSYITQREDGVPETAFTTLEINSVFVRIGSENETSVLNPCHQTYLIPIKRSTDA
jgi:hypothetical protein